MRWRLSAAWRWLLLALPTAALGQANCRNTGNFEAWLADFKKEALAKGISQSAIAAASPYLVLDQRIINIDRGQSFFAQNFLEISDKMLAERPPAGGAAQIKKHAGPVCARREGIRRAGLRHHRVLGTGERFRRRPGKDQAIKSLATLAYDCRRSDMFRGASVRRAAPDRARRSARRTR